jgi:hypothetical protein
MLLIVLYLAAIVAANLSVAAGGPKAAILNALLFIGLDLTMRDLLHDRWRGRRLWVRMAAQIAFAAGVVGSGVYVAPLPGAHQRLECAGGAGRCGRLSVAGVWGGGGRGGRAVRGEGGGGIGVGGGATGAVGGGQVQQRQAGLTPHACSIRRIVFCFSRAHPAVSRFTLSITSGSHATVAARTRSAITASNAASTSGSKRSCRS